MHMKTKNMSCMLVEIVWIIQYLKMFMISCMNLSIISFECLFYTNVKLRKCTNWMWMWRKHFFLLVWLVLIF